MKNFVIPEKKKDFTKTRNQEYVFFLGSVFLNNIIAKSATFVLQYFASLPVHFTSM